MADDLTYTSAPDDTESYDEFSFLAQNAAEMGVDWPNQRLTPRRVEVVTSAGMALSMIRWGDAPPEVVLLHGGGQNAHTWDSVVVATGRPALAIDLPAHGHSDRRNDGNYGPWANALAVGEVIERLAPDAEAVVGMSLGGATVIRLAGSRPDIVRRAVIIDVSPAVNEPGRAMTPEQRGTVALVGGAQSYDSFEEVFALTLSMSPLRTPEGVRRGVRHNTYRRADGRWLWRHDLHSGGKGSGDRHDTVPDWIDFTPLWDDVSASVAPMMLVLGSESVFVLPQDVEEFRRRKPTVRVETVLRSGHAVQSDQPAALVALLVDFLHC
jgi:pimeloyl-ACP methyl ester carboxylesterase